MTLIDKIIHKVEEQVEKKTHNGQNHQNYNQQGYGQQNYNQQQNYGPQGYNQQTFVRLLPSFLLPPWLSFSNNPKAKRSPTTKPTAQQRARVPQFIRQITTP
jgi:hypothetical protein